MASLFSNPNVRVGVRSGLPELRTVPKDAAKQHRFDPYTMNGGYAEDWRLPCALFRCLVQ